MKKEIRQLPRWAEHFLKTICPPELLEEIEGDLIQRFNNENTSTFRAKLGLTIAVLKYFRPGILLRNHFSMKLPQTDILENYLKSSLRHILKFRLNAIFKLTGLVLGLFSLLIIGMYVSYQLSFDRYHKDSERIYRVNTERKENGEVEKYAIAPIGFGSMLADGFPEVESWARVAGSNRSHVRYNDKVLWTSVYPVDNSLFDIFTFEFVSGNKGALKEPNAIVLTESMAKNLFGDESAMNKIVTINNGPMLFEVTAVIKDIPSNSHLHVDAFTRLTRNAPLNMDQIISPPEFVDNATMLFVKLRPDGREENFLAHLQKELDKFAPRVQRERYGFNISLQPLTDIYLDPQLKYEFVQKGNSVYLMVFVTLGFFMFCIACINYANLSLANFLSRAREMGVRKVLGGRKTQIVFQVMLESVLFGVVALALSLALLYFFFPQVVHYIEPNLNFLTLVRPSSLVWLSVIMLALIFISTALPAYWFATSKIANDLKGVYAQGQKITVSKSLLFAQFLISIICISVTLTIGRQVEFIHHKDLGIVRENLLVLTMAEDFSVNMMTSLKSELKRIPGITDVSNSSFRMGGGYWKDWYSVEVNGEMKSYELYEVFSDDALFETLGMKILRGRAFDADHRTDSGAAFVINETAAHRLGLEDPIGVRILTHPEDSGKWEGTIVGVVNDVNISTLHHEIQPLVMRLPWQKEYPEGFVYVRIDGNADEIIHDIRNTYATLKPGYPLEVFFVDDFYNKEYEKENRAYASLQFGTVIILLVSAMGVFSLSIYLSVRRMKEFGIRKVLGASAHQISYLHLSHFLKVALASAVLAIPISLFLIDQWLQGFAYHVEIGAGIFVLVLALIFLLVVLSGGYAALRAGRLNPVDVINKV